MVNYDVILNLVSIVLVLLILFMILFGCRGVYGRSYYERFSNPDEKSKEEEEKEKKPELSGFEKEILEQLSSGKLTTDAFTNLITTQKFTQQNLENMINYVESNKGVV